ncbi:hypothetical protein ACFY40_11530 [Streptomyces sp. NPDC012950]|uniref:hypothetical protein n=1 Tax=Streptomyces sp. NPDC012950 TaxID=3364858 RepID=UPI0036B134DC
MRIRLPRLRARRPEPAPTHPPVPLHDPAFGLPPGAIPLDVALQIAREALTRHQNANIHSRVAMYFTAVDYDHALRALVDAHDHPQDGPTP